MCSKTGYHSNGLHALTPLRRAKILRIRSGWLACKQPSPDKQEQDKHVESPAVVRLDGGSTPPISTSFIQQIGYGFVFIVQNSFFIRIFPVSISPLRASI